MTGYRWRVYLLVWLGMILTSVSSAATNRWVDVIFWVVGYVVIMSAVGSAVRSVSHPIKVDP